MARAAKSKPLRDVADLTKAQAKVEHMRLSLEIEGHNERYYQDDAPTVTDAEYDALRQRYDAIEKRFPEFVSGDSPSQKVGAAPSGRFRKVRHSVPMLSLDNAFAEEDVRDFVGRIVRFLKLDDDKIDFSRRAEDRRPVDVAALRGRRTRHRGDAWRRRGGRGRHRQHPHARRRAAEAEGPQHPRYLRGARRSLHDQEGFLALNEKQEAADGTISPIRATRPRARCGRRIRPSPPRARSASSPMPGAR